MSNEKKYNNILDLSLQLQKTEKNKEKTHDEILREQFETEEVLKQLKSYDGEDKIVTSSDLAEEIEAKLGDDVYTLNCDIEGIDNIIGGFREGQLNIVSAPTGNGKTSLLQTFTHHFSAKNVLSLWFSYEMSNEEMLRKFDQIPYFVIPREVRQGSYDWMVTKVIEAKQKFPKLKVVFIDHLHFLMDMELLALGNTSLSIGILMRKLKALAVEHDLIIFLVSHMKKAKIESTPTIEDLRDSSFIAQESDMVLMMWRLTEKDSASPMGFQFTNKSRLVVVKNRRTGQLGFVDMIYEDNLFREWTKADEKKEVMEGLANVDESEVDKNLTNIWDK